MGAARGGRASIHLRWGRVRSLDAERAGTLELSVDVDGAAAPAIAYLDLVGEARAGDRVLLNSTARDLGLGTGGVHLVVAVDRDPPVAGHSGRVMKARYLPHQVAVQSIEETDRAALEGTDLGGTPVVVAPLHSMIAPVAAGCRAAGVGRIVYVMGDGAAIPGAFSALVPRVREAGLLDAWVTAGQAFGGDVEAVTIWTGLLAAVRVLSADVVIVADGPGNLGTDTTWGVSALGLGHAANAADTLGGRPVVALRISFADRRERHRGVSHHSLTMLQRVVTARATVPVPALEEPDRTTVWDALRERALEERHDLVEVDGGPALDELARRDLGVVSMGRGRDEDPAFFLAAGAAGVLAGRMAARSASWRRELGSTDRA